jgi:hypothetical protein
VASLRQRRSTEWIGGVNVGRIAVSSDDQPSAAPSADDFDVVLVHGKTADGAGTKVLRARPGRLEAGEVRPMEQGRAIAPGAQIVQLSPREATPNVYDVKVEYEVGGAAPQPSPPSHGPAQVATRAYRDSWDRTFGARPREKTTN